MAALNATVNNNDEQSVMECRSIAAHNTSAPPEEKRRRRAGHHPSRYSEYRHQRVHECRTNQSPPNHASCHRFNDTGFGWSISTAVVLFSTMPTNEISLEYNEITMNLSAGMVIVIISTAHGRACLMGQQPGGRPTAAIGHRFCRMWGLQQAKPNASASTANGIAHRFYE